MSIKLKLFSPSEKLEIKGEIKSSKIIKKNKFVEDGLFSEQIFGPINDYTCQCGHYSLSGGICEKCGVEFTTSEKRMTTFSRIKLGFKIIYPPFLWSVKITKKNELIYDLINYKKYLILLDDNSYELLDIDENFEISSSDKNKFIGGNAVEKIFELMEKEETELGKSFKNDKLYQIWKNNKKYFFIDEIIVLPPDLRPIAFKNKNKMMFPDDINKAYQQIINKINSIKNVKFFEKISYITIKNIQNIQFICNDIYTKIFKIFDGKNGILRGNTLGKRIDFSGRAHIVPDPNLKLNEVRVSYYILLEIYKFHLLRKRVFEYNELFSTVLEDIENELLMKDYNFKYFKDLEEIIKDKVVILNRQPTLHKHSALAFYIKIGKDETISINPLICAPYNADFDGDQMALYFPITEEAINELKEKMLPSKNIFLEGTGDYAYRPSQDIVYGLYIASKQKNKQEILPKPLIDFMKSKNIEYLDKKTINLFLNKYLRKTKDVSILDKLKEIGFKYSTDVEIDISLKSLKKSNIDKEDKEKLKQCKNIEEYQELEKKLIKKMINKCSFSDIILSGSRGSLDQLKQMFIGKGYVADSENNIIETPITTSLVDGLTPYELFISSYGVRKGLSDIADSTARSGVFCRSLVYLAINTERDLNKDSNCKTERPLILEVNTPELAKALVDRYLAFNRDDFVNGKYFYVTLENAKELIGKKIYLRSPIFCKHNKLCQICAPGETRTIGINSALSLGETSTQLVLRTFHTSGVVTRKQKDSDKNQDITSDLTYVVRMFSKPDFNLDSISDYILELFYIFKNYAILKLINFETLVSNLLWTKDEENSELWRLHQNQEYEIVGMNQVPQRYSFLVSAAYGYFKRKIINNINKEIGDTIFDNILLGKF